MSFTEFLWRIVPAAARATAMQQAVEIQVRIAPNDFGGFSIFPANHAALCLFGGNEPSGNFASRTDARRRAERDNCWTVVERAEVRASKTTVIEERAGVTAAAALSKLSRA